MTAPSLQFSLGTGATSVPQGGFQLGGTGTAGGLNLGGTGAAGGFQFGGMGTAGGLGGTGTVGGLQLGGTGTAGGLQLGGTGTAGGLQLGGMGTAGGLQLGGTGTTSGHQLGGMKTAGGLKLGTSAASSGPLQLGMPNTLSSGIGGLKLGGGLITTTASSGFKLGTSTGGLQLGTAASVGGISTKPQLGQATSSSLKLGAPGRALQLGGLGQPSIGPTATSATGGLLLGKGAKSIGPSMVGSSNSGSQYTYKQLEGLVNKWSCELADQEKLFLQQAKQVQVWDRTLADSGDKIAEIDGEVKRVKKEQKKVDNELDLIKAQQTELERLLTEMEAEIAGSCSPVKVQYADQQRSQTFKMAEVIDSELKGMAKDLKEIIEEMNAANGNQDQTQSTFSQIVQILNAHTESLNWIDRETSLLKQKVEDVGKLAVGRKKEQEKSFRTTDLGYSTALVMKTGMGPILRARTPVLCEAFD